jgi:thioredoxin 1
MLPPYDSTQPSREAVDALPGDTVVEFGTNWCGICAAATPHIAAALASRPGLRHLRVEDGPGRALGRSFRVKLWPTLIVMRQGQEIARAVRPRDASAVKQALERLDA